MVTQLRRLAWAVHAWQNIDHRRPPHRGISNGGTEGCNRIVKHIGRTAVAEQMVMGVVDQQPVEPGLS